MRNFTLALANDVVRHRDNGGRIDPAAQFSQDGKSRSQTTPDRKPEKTSEVIFIFGIGLVADWATVLEKPVSV
jgi:hypothetical protein